MAIDVKEFIMTAIKEGISEAPILYMQHLEKQLATDIKIQESGDASKYLQELISEAETSVSDMDF